MDQAELDRKVARHHARGLGAGVIAQRLDVAESEVRSALDRILTEQVTSYLHEHVDAQPAEIAVALRVEEQRVVASMHALRTAQRINPQA